MQETYFTSQHLEGEAGANNYTMKSYVPSYIKVRMAQHTPQDEISPRMVTGKAVSVAFQSPLSRLNGKHISVTFQSFYFLKNKITNYKLYLL